MRLLCVWLAACLFVAAAEAKPKKSAKPGRRTPATAAAKPQVQPPATQAAPPTATKPAGPPPGPAIDPGADALEILTANEHLEFPQLDPEPNEALQWDPSSAKFLYISATRSPFLFLTGSVREGYRLTWNHREVPIRDGRFQIRVDLPLEPKSFLLRLHGPSGSFQTMRFVNYWVKVPPAMTAAANSGYAAFSLKYRNTAFVQLYSGKNAASVVDLDSTKHAKLTFRLFPPPIPDEAYDGWRLTLRDERNRLVGELSRFGEPPAYVDWRDVGTSFERAGKYSYRVTLYRDDKVFEGPVAEFEAIEGLSLLNHRYLPAVQFEPKEEVGYYFFRNKSNESHSHLYVGADLPLALWNRFLIRFTGLMSLYTTNPTTTLTYTRLGGGFRIFGQGHSPILGNPHIFRLDVYLTHTGYTVASAYVRRFSQFAMLIEPHLVLWGYHYFVPWLELGLRHDMTQARVSFGSSYQFFVRPWSVRMGMGLAFDELVHAEGNQHLRFSIMRVLTSITFFL